MDIETYIGNSNNPFYRLIISSGKEWLDRWELVTYKQDEIICHIDEVYEYFYVLIEGELNIYHINEKGKTYSQSVYVPGNYFGELEIFESLPYVCEIKALTEVKILRLQKKYFIEWVHTNNEVTLYLLTSLCRITYDLSQKAIEDTLYSLKYRICDYLLQRYSELNDGTHEVIVKKELLSEQLVVTKRSINRILKILQDKGYISITKDKIYIKDSKGLVIEREKERY